MSVALPPTLRFIERDWLSSNGVLLLDGDDEATLIDTGYVKHAATTVSVIEHALADAPGGPRRLARIVNTHLHSDHCGGNAALVARFGARVTVPAATWDAVRDWDRERLSHAATAQQCPRFEATEALQDGECFTAGGIVWQAIAAPGHDPTSLIFHAPRERLLVSADALWENGFGLLFPELGGHSGVAEERAVLEAIAKLAPRVVLPGHGRAFTDVGAALARAHARLDAIAADPERGARHALKVLVKFRLLEHERERFDDMLAQIASASVMRDAAALTGRSLEAALACAVDSLERAGHVVRVGPWLVDR